MIGISLFATVCEEVYAHGCTPCDRITGTYAYHTELRQYCKCVNHTELIYYEDNDATKPLACEPVPKGKIVTDFMLVDSTCAENQYYEPIYKKCTNCPGATNRRTENGLCLIPDGWEIMGPNARCALGYEKYSVEEKFAGCRPCENGTYSIMPRHDSLEHFCGKCADSEFRDIVYCHDFIDGCAIMAWDEEMTPGRLSSGEIDKTCRCSFGDFPLYSIKAKMYSCKECAADLIKTQYNGAGLPAYLCRQKGKTLLNTTCPPKYPLDEKTGLCACPHRYATAAGINEANQTLEESICVPVLLDALHINTCNEHSLFYFEYKGVGEVYCTRRNEMGKQDPNKLSSGAIAGIAVGAVALVAIVAGLIAYFMCKRKTQSGVIGATGNVAQSLETDAELII